MEVRRGYKQTEVGVIPEDWAVKRLGDLAPIQTGNTPPTRDPRNYGDEFLFVSPVDMGSSKYISRTEKMLAKKGFSISRPFPAGSVLFVCIGSTIGKSGVALVALTSNQQINAVLPSDTVTTDYLYYAVSAAAGRIRSLAGEQAVPIVNKTQFSETAISLPSTRAEQEAIAEALSDSDAFIESVEQLLTKKRQIKQGAMQELLTGKKRLPGFSGKWEAKRLGDLGRFFKGSGVTKDQTRTGSLACVRYGEIYTHHTDCIREFFSWISEGVAATATRIQQGDILFAGSGETKEEIGKCVAFVSHTEAYAGGDIVILRPENSDSRFLGYYLNSTPITSQKAHRGQGDAVVHISATALSDIQCVLPSTSEQTAIAAVLSDMDAEIAALETKLAKARQVKQGLMQELLTGRIRLV